MSYAANSAEVRVEHAARAAGRSKYRLYDLVRLNFDLMTGFSVLPLQLFTLFGLALAVGNLLFAVYMFTRRIVRGPEAGGLFTLFAILYFLVGVGILGLGVIGEYIGRIYQEVRRRPRFVIRHVYEDLDDK
jgi:undecaprenyl-phosphate 4-deoxy-4-formamido-L-arabinose transferase